MSKYKKVNEGIIDNFISALFNKAGKGLESATIRKLSKTDPDTTARPQQNLTK